MGLSVSGSVAVILVAVIIAFGTVHAAGSNGIERVQNAQDTAAEHRLAQDNSDITISAATYNATNATLRVVVRNTGTTALGVSDTDVLVDNTYLTNATTAVDDDTTTDLWLPGEQLAFTVSLPSAPEHVKVVARYGIADRAVV